MTFYNVEYFQKRKKEMEDVFNVIKPDLQELADYFLPRSAQFIARNTRKPYVKSKKIIDSTPLIALRNFSSGMMSGATSPTNRWFKTVFTNADLANDYYLKNWCSNQEELTIAERRITTAELAALQLKPVPRPNKLFQSQSIIRQKSAFDKQIIAKSILHGSAANNYTNLLSFLRWNK